jgi:hypothetical protein
MRSHSLMATAATAALLLGAAAPAAVLAQTTVPAPSTAQQGQPMAPGGSVTRSETQGRPAVPAAGQDHSQSMERLSQAAQRLREAVQSMAQQPAGERRNEAMAQAREALQHTQQAMVTLPADLRTRDTYRQAEQRVAEAQQALQGGDRADPERARQAVDAYLVLVPRMRSEMGAGATTAAPGTVSAGPTTASVPLQRVTSLMGTDLIGPNGEKVAEIENLLVDAQGNVRAVVVEWGGFLGIGDREALVPVDRIQLGAAANDRARIGMTREELERLPRFDRDRLAEYGREHGWGEGLRWHR